MQPLALTLKGFRGIRDGLGRDEITLDLERLTQDAQLIAIVGANGSGKSTIMDCLVPYIGLPSRAALAGAGGFSYYDHVYLPESVKDLTWAHEGRCYRSQIVIRLCGRRRTEAFLHTLDDAGHWRPVQLDDGMVSDGRVETYTRCVEAICGSAETFFTSVFAAQGKRQLSTYRNAEIKSLLADLLGQEEIQALGQKAAETVRLLKAGLATIRQELVGLDAEGVRLEATRRRLDGAGERMAAAERAKTAAHSALEAAQARHARVAVEREQSRATEARRAQLAAERQSTLDTTAQARRALQSRDQVERQRLEQLDQRVAGRRQQECSRRQALTLSRQRCQAVLAEAGEVQRADRRLPLAQRVQALRSALTEACRQQTHALTRCQGAVRLAEHRVAGIEQEAGRAALKAEELARRFGLTGEVPCVGTDLQGRCKLLGDAREAQSLLPNAHALLARQLFPEAPLKWMPPTKHMTGDVFRGHLLDGFFNLAGAMTGQGILLVGMMTEAVVTPWLSDRDLALQNVRYVLNAAGGLTEDFHPPRDGFIQTRARQVLDEAVALLDEIATGSGGADTAYPQPLLAAIADGTFGAMKRPPTKGKGLDGVARKADDYDNPAIDLLETVDPPRGAAGRRREEGATR